MKSRPALTIVLAIAVILVVSVIVIVTEKNEAKPNGESSQITPVPENANNVMDEEKTSLVVGFSIMWGYDTYGNSEKGVWIYFDNEKGVQIAKTSTADYTKLEKPTSYSYTSEEEYLEFADFNQILILKNQNKYLAFMPVNVSEEQGKRILYYSFKEL